MTLSGTMDTSVPRTFTHVHSENDLRTARQVSAGKVAFGAVPPEANRKPRAGPQGPRTGVVAAEDRNRAHTASR